MNFIYLDIAIGLIFIYLLLSLFSTIIMELISTVFRMRAELLKQTIQKMLDGDHCKKIAVDQFYNQPLIKFLGEYRHTFGWDFFNNTMPSYLESTNFSKNLMDLMDKSGEETLDLSSKINNPKWNISDDTRAHLLSLCTASGANAENFKKELEIWFNQNMERANLLYKRKTQVILIWLGFFIALLFNADSIEIVQKLQNNPKLRNEVVNAASDFVNQYDSIQLAQNHISDSSKKDIDSLRNFVIHEYHRTLSESDDLLGWKGKFDELIKGSIFQVAKIIKLLGFFLTALAISLGSTFWFDILKKLIGIKTLGNNKK